MTINNLLLMVHWVRILIQIKYRQSVIIILLLLLFCVA